ncbi:MAG: LamG-like jellyroll fold domain-containing protein [Salinarchaeum sp.]
MAPIRRGDGTGLTPKGYTEVRKGDRTVLWSAIPDSGDLHAHWDATQLSLDDGDAVTTWDDPVGDNDATGNATYRTGQISGNAVVRFDGTDDYLDVVGDTLSQPYHVFVVAEHAGLGTSNQELIDGGDDSDRAILQFDGGDDRWYAGTPDGNLMGGGNPDTDSHLFTFLIDGSNSYFRIDGAQVNTKDVPGKFNLISIGARSDNTQNFDGDIGEISIHDTALSNSDESEWESYLADKWGITLA